MTLDESFEPLLEKQKNKSRRKKSAVHEQTVNPNSIDDTPSLQNESSAGDKKAQTQHTTKRNSKPTKPLHTPRQPIIGFGDEIPAFFYLSWPFLNSAEITSPTA